MDLAKARSVIQTDEHINGIDGYEVSGTTGIRHEPLDDRAKEPSHCGSTSHGDCTPERNS